MSKIEEQDATIFEQIQDWVESWDEGYSHSEEDVYNREMVRRTLALLRAGQGMREAMFNEAKSDLDAADAWDAALKGDDE